MAETPSTVVPLRLPSHVMRLKRLGSLHQSRLSFMRILTRRLAREGWHFSRPKFNIDAKGVGHAVYCAKGPDRTYSLVAFAHDLPDEKRSDRVIAEAWDTTFALFDGTPTDEDIARLDHNVPLQEAGRITGRELTLSRANRSVRLWAHVVDRLAKGQQPDTDEIARVGYLMRTTAVYGSGKFGAADRETIEGRDEMKAPFQAELLTVYLIRAFVRDLVEHLARAEGGEKSVTLDPAIAQTLGIGNSTGLGMAPFIINHPILFNNWIRVREEAIARVRGLPEARDTAAAQFRDLVARCQVLVADWRSDHPAQVEKLAGLTRDLDILTKHVDDEIWSGTIPWDRLCHWSEAQLTPEGQELVASLILEPHGALVDDLADDLSDSLETSFQIDGDLTVATTREQIVSCFGWALSLDWSAQEAQARAWYVSEEKLEPRLGQRFEEPIAEYEQPLAPARDAVAAYGALNGWDKNEPIAEFLLAHPEHRHTIRRAQISALAPYSEIHDNTIGADVMPIDMLRAKLSFFGATKFDPRSDRWVRICMYAGAPYPEDLTPQNADFWVYPEL